jgi:hypothetical protein
MWHNMKNLIKALILSIGLMLIAPAAHAAVPWGTTGPLQVSGATPTCTYTATSLACIENMTANVTSITLAGMTAGVNYTLILMQDGTGSRTLVQSSVTGAPALVAAESAANGYAVWTINATSASAATFVSDNSNAPLFDVYKAQFTSSATVNGSGTTVSQGTAVFPGLSVNDTCICMPQTTPATWQTGAVIGCLPATNLATCQTSNASAGSITPAAVSVNVRGIQ